MEYNFDGFGDEINEELELYVVLQVVMQELYTLCVVAYIAIEIVLKRRVGAFKTCNLRREDGLVPLRREMPVDLIEERLNNDIEDQPQLGDDFVETSNEWTGWQDTLAMQLYNNWLASMDSEVSSSRKKVKEKVDPSKPRQLWSPREEQCLINALMHIVNNGMKQDNAFKANYLMKLEEKLLEILPGTNLCGTPHIESKIKIWKKHYNYVAGMLGPADAVDAINAEEELWFNSLADDGTFLEHMGISSHIGEGINCSSSSSQRPPESSTKKNDNKKRPRGNDDVVEGLSVEGLSMIANKLGEIFSATNEKLDFIGRRMGYEHDLISKRASLNDELIKLLITLDERLDACEIISQSIQKLDMFFSLTHDDKLRFYFKQGNSKGDLDSGNKSSKYLHDIIIKCADRHNLLRPETIESFLSLYRITADPKENIVNWAGRFFRHLRNTQFGKY
ncbi:Mannosyl-oligosaccharide 1,2-alpha-mannosidase MNS3 [Camellia lanceoleosa]|uniref:Mannosyl-oligosaccharide 1,2-alpha-mannosidase MNS3 n=1 Tax=Camellia lanceoleosa TaxID=1840588 RepID=A0ACC0GNJ0_9ERIC|nr:Mannosyl-oligosaccharide 1,2-alpha-mannosidase MNS3 [Camellia lanceoleosa]